MPAYGSPLSLVTLMPVTTLAIAAGGGGDALGVLLAARLIDGLSEPPVIATLAWERLRLDPTPGPRSRAGFIGLGLVDGEPAELMPNTRPRDADAISSLPRLAEETGARLLLLDASTGATGLADQMDGLAEAIGADRLIVLDVGGDAIARGDEPGLMSPLADALIIAAAARTELPGAVVVTGPGLDAELSEAAVMHRARQLDGQQLGQVHPPGTALLNVLRWHPSEASALLAAAARGLRGQVDMRRGGGFVPLTSHSAAAWRLDLQTVATASSYAKAVADSTTMVAARLRTDTELTRAELAHRVTAHALDAVARGADYVTTRRLAEVVQAPAAQTAELIDHLSQVDGANDAAPLWNLHSLAATLTR
jgi:hypothetical protein